MRGRCPQGVRRQTKKVLGVRGPADWSEELRSSEGQEILRNRQVSQP